MKSLIFVLLVMSLPACGVAAGEKAGTTPTPSAAPKAPLELKGIRLGMTYEELLAAYPNGKEAPGQPRLGGMACFSGNTFCTVGVGTLARVATVLQVNLSEGKVADAYMGRILPGDFDGVVAALQEKYGAPTSKTQGFVQNRMGAKFDNPSFVWNFPDGKLIATKFMPGAPMLDISQVEMASTAWLAEKEAKQKARANDL
ncbi:MAG: hypothetical protein ACYC9L_06730 [Sulfuricaulis sp.]